MKDTGLPQQDAQSDFARQRRRVALSRIAARLRFEPDDVSEMLPFEEVVAALGRVSQRDLGLQSITLDSIVGTVARRHSEFDRKFLPTSSGVRGRWERIAIARRRGHAMPPIDVYRIGELHFVEDGHHRVSVGRAMGDTHIDAYVKEVRTAVGAGADLTLSDLPLKRHERIFRERVPLAPALRARIQLSDEWRYAQLSVLIEAWGLRARRRGHRDRALPSNRDASLSVADHSRVVGRGGRTACGRGSPSLGSRRHDGPSDPQRAELSGVRRARPA